MRVLSKLGLAAALVAKPVALVEEGDALAKVVWRFSKSRPML